MRLRRLELAVIALTLAFICFMGGYFTGRRGAVNVVTIEPRQGETQQIARAAAPSQEGAASPAAEAGGAVAPGTETGESGAAGTEGAAGAAGSETDAGDALGETPEVVGAPRGGDGRININLASQSELQDLPGIGSVLASRIVDYRRQHGDFSRIEDLRNVSGIGAKRFEAIQDRVTVG